MSEVIYVDTNVWLDYCLGTQAVVPLDEFAKQILTRSLACEFTILLSTMLIHELEKKIDSKKLVAPLKIKNKLRYVDFTKSDIKKAKKHAIHYPDCLHILLAEKHNCTYLITNDTDMLKINANVSIVNSQFFQFN